MLPLNPPAVALPPLSTLIYRRPSSSPLLVSLARAVFFAEARRRAVEEEEQKRQAVIDRMKELDERRCRPGSAIKRAGGGFVLSFSGDGSSKSAAPKSAWS